MIEIEQIQNEGINKEIIQIQNEDINEEIEQRQNEGINEESSMDGKENKIWNIIRVL